MKHYLVIGRMCYDDEDTGSFFQVETKEEAVRLYAEEMWEQNFNDGCYTAAEKADARQLLEADGEGVFVIGVYESESPIMDAT